MSVRPEWQDFAACRGTRQVVFFPDSKRSGTNTPRSYKEAREICSGCPVSDPCLDMAIEAEWGRPKTMRHGMFGGLTPRERMEVEKAQRILSSDLDAGVFS